MKRDKNQDTINNAKEKKTQKKKTCKQQEPMPLVDYEIGNLDITIWILRTVLGY